MQRSVTRWPETAPARGTRACLPAPGDRQPLGNGCTREASGVVETKPQQVTSGNGAQTSRRSRRAADHDVGPARHQVLQDRHRRGACPGGYQARYPEGGVHLHPRSVRLRQEHAALGHVRPARSDRRRGHPQRHAGHGTAARDRHDLPGRQSAALARPLAEHPLPVRDQEDRLQAVRRARSRGCSTRSAWPASRRRSRASSPAACSSAPASCAASPTIPK